MCGIAGIVDFAGRSIDQGALRAMTDALVHRGPDDAGFYYAGGEALGVSVGLGHCRLSIIDLSPNGRQPMSNEAGDVLMVFNGEIYNFRELRDELEEKGHRFRSRTDCEVVIHAYEEYGPACVERINGMFAFALWDERARRILLARDRVGKKPLLYAWDGRRLLFASEFQGLLACTEVSREPEPFALDLFLQYGVIPAPLTAFTRIRKLRPGHLAEVSTGSFEERPYWQLSFQEKRPVDESNAVEELRSLIIDAVKSRLISDVPLGAFLSGGVDSSAVVAMMSRAAEGQVKTFSIGFPVAAYNELPYARLVAKRYGTLHKEFVVEPDAIEVLPLLVRHYGEPFADSSALPSYYLARMTRQHVTVALNGDGGDECFGGYERQWANALAERVGSVPRPVLRGLLSVLPDSVDPKNRWRRLRRFLAVATESPLARYRHWLGIFPSSLREFLYTPEFYDTVAADSQEDPFDEAFPVAAYNELPYARLVAKRYGTLHKEFVVEPDAIEVLPLLVRHYGEPFADSSALPSYYLARMTRQHVTVALNGDGGDECFGGYERQWANALAERVGSVPRPVLRGLLSVLPDSVDPKNRWRRLRRFLAVATESPLARYRHWLGIFPSSLREFLYTPEFYDTVAADSQEDPFDEAFRKTEGLDPIDQAIAIDTAFYLPHDLMVKMDIASMANSLEVRSPLLDYRLLEYCASLPGPMKIRRGRLKHLLKEVMREELPSAVLDRPKQGFGVPIGSWYRGELEPFLRELLLSPKALDRGLFQPDAVREIVESHIQETHDYAFHLWALMMLELWFQTFIDNHSSSAGAEDGSGE